MNNNFINIVGSSRSEILKFIAIKCNYAQEKFFFGGKLLIKTYFNGPFSE